MDECHIIKDTTQYYVWRKVVAKSKYGTVKSGAQYITKCGNERCVTHNHLVLLDRIFDEMGAKPCNECGVWKPKEDYYPTSASPNGYQTVCKECIKKAKEIRTGRKSIEKEKFNSLEDKFNRYVVKKEGCWEWSGPKNKKGYGLLSLGTTKTTAYRFSYEVFNGPIPEGELIRHKCNNPECTNPEHLLTGNHKDNADDMVKAKRHAHGEKTYNAKLTEADVIDIKTNCPVGSGYSEYARKYGVSHITIRDIVLGKYWKHVVVEKAA